VEQTGFFHGKNQTGKNTFCRQKPIFAGKKYFCRQKVFLPVRFMPELLSK